MSGKEIDVRKVLVIAALGSAGFFGVAACTAVAPAISQSPKPAGVQPLSPTAPTGNGNAARDIAKIAVGKDGLAALYNGRGSATAATCDPSTVSNPRDAGNIISASCGINYSDGSVWKQAVTVTFDGHGNPVAVSANLGTEVLQPTG